MKEKFSTRQNNSFLFQEYDSFVQTSSETLSQTIEGENFNVLLNIMTTINHIKQREKLAEQVFETMKKDLFALLQYDVHVSKKVLGQVRLLHCSKRNSLLNCLCSFSICRRSSPPCGKLPRTFSMRSLRFSLIKSIQSRERFLISRNW